MVQYKYLNKTNNKTFAAHFMNFYFSKSDMK